MLHALNHVPENVHENTMLDEYTNSALIGENIIAFWIEADNSIQWYLGVVDGVNSDLSLQVSYMKRSDKTGKQWMFPECAEVLCTMADQILMRKVCVAYNGSVTIRCRLFYSKSQNILI